MKLIQRMREERIRQSNRRVCNRKVLTQSRNDGTAEHHPVRF